MALIAAGPFPEPDPPPPPPETPPPETPPPAGEPPTTPPSGTPPGTTPPRTNPPRTNPPPHESAGRTGSAHTGEDHSFVRESAAPWRPRTFAMLALGLLGDQPFQDGIHQNGALLSRALWLRLGRSKNHREETTAILTALGRQIVMGKRARLAGLDDAGVGLASRASLFRLTMNSNFPARTVALDEAFSIL